MAACYRKDLEGQRIDTYPLLMDHPSVSSNQEHIINISTGNSCRGDEVERGSLYRGSIDSSANPQGDIGISVGPPAVSPTDETQLTPSAASLRRGGTGELNPYATHQRSSPLNSGLWISIELIITLCQIIASVIVLSLARHEKPHAPLAVWVIGYAAGCFATLPLLFWRYAHRYARQPYQNPSTPSAASPRNPSATSPSTSYSLPIPPSTQQQGEGGFSSVLGSHITSISGASDARFGLITERYKVALDCFFAVWFVIGNVWVFGGRTSSSEAPNLYRLCIVFLTFSCIGYAMPFILCATICCCLPCIITLLGLRDDQKQTKGASQEVIDALPSYKFKSKGGNGVKGNADGNDSDCDGPGDGGLVAAGTENERTLSAEDAVCCICLGKYKDGVELRELPCTHFFHVECVDKWLKINASCPLCKLKIDGSGEQSGPPVPETGE